MKAYVYKWEDEDFDDLIDEIEGDSNEEIEALFDENYCSNDYKMTYTSPSKYWR